MTDSVRIDKWLWAARFYKTRSLAAQAVGGGKAPRLVETGRLAAQAVGEMHG